MSKQETIVRFDGVSFEYTHAKPILDSVDLSIRRGSKIALMGQNGAGKSTLFDLLCGAHTPSAGTINVVRGTSIATARQVIPREQLPLTVRAFFQACFSETIYDIDPRIDAVLDVVELKGHEKIHDRVVSSFSGGQQARLLLASALIQNPDLLLLDEPTNNLDHAGIAHLTAFLRDYPKTVIVISHDADFLNAFTEGVFYLDIHTRKIEQYVGNYSDVVRDIVVRIEKENRKNAQLAKGIEAKKAQAGQFAQKGGKMRLVAKKMREKAEELADSVVAVRKEDSAIRPFSIPVQKDIGGDLLSITSFTTRKLGKIKKHTTSIILRKNTHLLLKGPNGIGKSTLLEALATGTAEGSALGGGVRIGYYRQDFSTLDFTDTVYHSLQKAMEASGIHFNEERMRSVAASFLITKEVIYTKIGALSEGQKGLVAFAGLVLLEPGILILDEPTNHINFRHLPAIAKALDSYSGAMILVSHVPDFIAQIRIDETLDLGK